MTTGRTAIGITVLAFLCAMLWTPLHLAHEEHEWHEGDHHHGEDDHAPYPSSDHRLQPAAPHSCPQFLIDLMPVGCVDVVQPKPTGDVAVLRGDTPDAVPRASTAQSRAPPIA